MAPSAAALDPSPRLARGLRLALVVAAAGGALAYGGYAAWFVFGESRLLFMPAAQMEPPPPDLAPRIQRVAVPARDGVQLRAWVIPPEVPHDSAGWVLFFHGAGGNVSREVRTLRLLARSGLGVVAAEYRGYGEAAGRTSEAAMYADARTMYEWLVRERHVEPARLVLFGGSRGSAVAIELATHVPVAALVLASAPRNKVESMRRAFPGLPVRLLQRNRFESDRRIGAVRAPMLFLHGRDDAVVPLHEARGLYLRARAPKRFVTVRGGHADMGDGDEDRVLAFMMEFLGEHTRIPAAVRPGDP